MKYLFTIFVVLLMVFTFAPIAGAQDVSKTLTFAWDDTNIANPDLEYVLFMRRQGEDYNYDQPALVIPYAQATSTGSHQATGEFNLPATPGEAVIAYFVLRARLGDLVSENSNEVSQTFQAPPGVPMNFTITVVVTTGE